MAIFTAAEALAMAMEIERNGETFYRAVAQQGRDPELKALFEELADQEQAHFRVFQRMSGEKSAPLPSLPAEEYDQYQAYLQAALDNALFAGPDKALDMAKRAQDRKTALRAALGFEKDTILFFYDLREMVSEADRQTVAAIIAEEKKHLRRLAHAL